MTDICSEKCMGHDDNHGGCCTMYDRDYIIGPHDDCKEFVERLKIHFGRNIEHSDVFIDYEEGRKMFPKLSHWKDETSYPAMRINTLLESKPCIFYNENVKRCTVYEIRPNTCRDYKCQYLKSMGH
jgi:Fe-S-cluster containining protein